VLGAESTIGAAVAEAIERAGNTVIRVTRGSGFSTRAGRIEIDAVNPEHYVRIFEEAAVASAGQPARIVFAADEARRDNALRAIMAARAVAQLPNVAPICYVTRGAQSLVASEAPDIAQAPLWGVARALALEQPQRFGGIVDLDPASSLDAGADAALEFVAGSTERQAAIRSGAWFAPRLVPVTTRVAGAVRLRNDAAYLVTGGLGRLGLQTATWLAANGAGHLVLLGRRGLPPRAQWADLPPKSDAARQVQAIAKLERLGAQVTVCAADASDPTAMRELFSGFGGALPPLRGIVHAAGRIDYRPVDQIGAAEVADVFRAKVDGTLILDALSRDGRHPIDFFVMFSSGASVWGSRHLAHYSAANHALDAIAHARRAAGLPATAINWGWWEGGATTAEAEALFSQSGLQAMPADDALEAMGDAIAADVPQRIVAAVDWRTFKPILESVGSTLLARLDTMTEPAAAARPRGTLLRELESLPPEAARSCIEAHLRSEVGAVIGRDPSLLDVNRGFFKLGMDSLMTVELRRRLEAALDRTLPATIAFEYPNIGALASFLAEQIAGAAVSALPTAVDDVAAALDEQSDDELALMLDGEIARLLTEEERTN
jgi:myxalamid-type polyketide synthase MxaE and MxaD